MAALRTLQLHSPDDVLLAREAAHGLMQASARLSPKFLYDPLGSRLFEAITALPEYYITRTEAQIVTVQRESIAGAIRAALPEIGALIDLGAGNGAKASGWFDTLAVPRYVAVDISVDFLRDAIEDLSRRFPAIPMTTVGMDFSARLAFPPGELPAHCLMHYPGSSIGNFSPVEAHRLLAEARAQAHQGALLIGVDLVKSDALLVPAYDDILGVTAAFNLNLLLHLNRILGSDFDPRDWLHVALYSHSQARIEMHLQARRPVTVCWPGQARHFESGERIHTENSYKWTIEGFTALLKSVGYQQVQHWSDPQEWFAVFLASA